MGATFRSCQDCGGEQLFEQPHEAPGSCPDSPDGRCPEWSCIECGATVVMTATPSALCQATALAGVAAMPDMVGRVA
jgi:hypothetical protein